MAPRLSLEQTFRGVLPFWAIMIAALAVEIAFPGIPPILPNIVID